MSGARPGLAPICPYLHAAAAPRTRRSGRTKPVSIFAANGGGAVLTLAAVGLGLCYPSCWNLTSSYHNVLRKASCWSP